MSEQNLAKSGGALRPVLWFALVLSMAANALANISGLPVPIGVGFGLITLGCAAALAVQHYRNRAR